MKLSHSWDLSPKEAFELQSDLAVQVECQPRMGPVRHVAGVDVSVRDDVGRAAVVVLDLEGLAPVDYAVATRPATFPYVPGLLAFREAPVLLAAFAKLRCEPDVLVFDAHGLALPRRMGLACHLGLVLDRPSIGCAKAVLVGDHADLRPEFTEAVSGWLRSGELVVRETVREGLELAVPAFLDLLRGGNTGKMVVRLAEDAD